jgi:hypothetical protein
MLKKNERVSKFRVHAIAKPYFGFANAWALKKFFSQTIELRTLSPNFDSHYDYLYLASS